MGKFDRYKLSFEKFGLPAPAQDKIINTGILVMGAGALGSAVIANLAALGFGKIKLIDDDILKEEDFNCQFIHKYSNLGRAKVMSAKDWIQEYNPDIKVELVKTNLDELNYFNLIQGYDIIIDCFQNYEQKFLLNDIAQHHNKILIHGATQGFKGHLTTIVPGKTGCLRCAIQLHSIYNAENSAMISPVISTIASMQALEAVKVVCEVGEPLYNKILTFNGLKSEFLVIPYAKNPICRSCSEININTFD